MFSTYVQTALCSLNYLCFRRHRGPSPTYITDVTEVPLPRMLQTPLRSLSNVCYRHHGGPSPTYVADGTLASLLCYRRHSGPSPSYVRHHSSPSPTYVTDITLVLVQHGTYVTVFPLLAMLQTSQYSLSYLCYRRHSSPSGSRQQTCSTRA